MPAALLRQSARGQIRNAQVVIREAGRIVARRTRQAANQRSRQVIAGHWAGLVPQRAIVAAQTDGLALAVALDAVQCSPLARPLNDDAAMVVEVS